MQRTAHAPPLMLNVSIHKSAVAPMKVLSIRFCSVSVEAESLAKFFDALGLPRKNMDEPASDSKAFMGAVFPAADSWIEIWSKGPEMPEGIMLQIVVDDADAFAVHAKENGLNPKGPMDAHGERIYFLRAPSGLHVSFQSSLA
jgi:hypothetical protein